MPVAVPVEDPIEVVGDAVAAVVGAVEQAVRIRVRGRSALCEGVGREEHERDRERSDGEPAKHAGDREADIERGVMHCLPPCAVTFCTRRPEDRLGSPESPVRFRTTAGG